jgi:DNA-binding NtrC family response regulator
MPSQVVIVLDDPEFANRVATAISAAGCEAAAFTDSMAALGALEAAHRVELLVTSVNFAPGKPNGIALARMTRRRRPDIKVLFVGAAGLERYTDGVGKFMPVPISEAELVGAATRLLQAEEQD